MTPLRAKSRLKKTKPPREKIARIKSSDEKKPNLDLGKFKKRFKQLPILVGSIFTYLILWWFLHNISPTKIENIVFAKSYLPFHFLLFVGNFLLLKFIFSNSRASFLISSLIFWVMFLKLQQVTFDLWAILSIVGLGLIILGWQLLTRKFNKKPYNERKKSYV